MFIIMGTIALLGVLCGAIYVNICQVKEQDFIMYYINEFLNYHKSETFAVLTSFVFLSSLILHIIAVAMGFSCIGMPIVAVLPLIKGFTIGCVSSYLYNEMGIKGALLNLLMLWLPQVLQTVLLVMLCAHAFILSKSLFGLALGSNNSNSIQIASKLFVKAFTFTSFFLLFTSIIESMLSQIFASVMIN
ncbi:MAG: hypothetical protein RR654_01575 [Oscillospiraceae bacterium]